MSKKLIIANWKMHPLTLREAGNLIDAVEDAKGSADVVIAPPFVFIEYVSSLLSGNTKLASQDVCWEDPSKGGAYTGEVSATMLKKLGVDYVIVGHSERRQHLQETDALIGKKLGVTIATGMTAVLCIGEPIEIRKKGMSAVKQYIRKQLDGALKEIKFPALQSKKIVVAYEPIWAIGTGVIPTAEEAGEAIDFIRTVLAEDYAIKQTRILYGGSVNSKDIAGFLNQKGIDGALVGGASINPKEFAKMLKLV